MSSLLMTQSLQGRKNMLTKPLSDQDIILEKLGRIEEMQKGDREDKVHLDTRLATLEEDNRKLRTKVDATEKYQADADKRLWTLSATITSRINHLDK